MKKVREHNDVKVLVFFNGGPMCMEKKTIWWTFHKVVLMIFHWLFDDFSLVV